MNRQLAAHLLDPDDGASLPQAIDDATGSLVTLELPQLDSGDPWPMNFIVMPSDTLIPEQDLTLSDDGTPEVDLALLPAQTMQTVQVVQQTQEAAAEPWIDTARPLLDPEESFTTTDAPPPEQILPVLTVRADSSAYKWDSRINESVELHDRNPFAPTLFGPKMRQQIKIEDDVDDEELPMYADPPEAPVWPPQYGGWGFNDPGVLPTLLALLVLLTLAVGGWWWL